MRFIWEHWIAIFSVLLLAQIFYIVRLVIKKREEKEGDRTTMAKTSVWPTVLSVGAFLLHFGLCAYLLIIGGEIVHILPILLLSLIGVLL